MKPYKGKGCLLFLAMLLIAGVIIYLFCLIARQAVAMNAMRAVPQWFQRDTAARDAAMVGLQGPVGHVRGGRTWEM